LLLVSRRSRVRSLGTRWRYNIHPGTRIIIYNIYILDNVALYTSVYIRTHTHTHTSLPLYQDQSNILLLYIYLVGTCTHPESSRALPFFTIWFNRTRFWQRPRDTPRIMNRTYILYYCCTYNMFLAKHRRQPRTNTAVLTLL